MNTQNNAPSGEVIFEFIQVGIQMRVAAVHVNTGTEVVIVASAKTPQSQMKKIALAKLNRRLQREAGI